ncbi:WD40/YVTN/BNR-like repeat-containing protein [Fibrella aquatilis]|uniref:Glycosyl hydrolase n=1 Tax=Fibrella aquatilis TaxID=2817059 RepID=A0A939G2L4_9BACT|nr:sialidase family protein [Fibrella aquatilis]MBO0929489.1 glycosyl hydrolase [Fibrella aquatilis]
MNRLLLSCGFLLLLSPVFAQKKAKKNIPTIPIEVAATSAADRLAGAMQRMQQAKTSLVQNLPVTSIGPTVMSGRVVDLAVNPLNVNQFYVAYASGGLWRTDNNGISFTPLFQHEAVMTLGALAVDWKGVNTDAHTIWLGTGEANASRSSYAGVGCYKSTNGGKTWQHLPGLDETHHIGKIALHPTNPDVAWVATVGHLYTDNSERGLYKTTDGGTSWKRTLYIDTQTGAIDVDVDSANPQVVYAAMWHKERKAWNFVESGATSGLYKSTDGGNTWKLISGGTSGLPQDAKTGRMGLSIFPGNTQTMYVILDNQSARPEKKTKKDDVVDARKLTKDRLRVISKEEFLKAEDSFIADYLEEQNFPEKYTPKTLKEMVQADKIKPVTILEYTDDANSRLINAEVIGAEVYRSDDGGGKWRKVNADFLDGLFNTYGYYFGNVWVAPDNADKIVIAGVPVIGSTDGGKTYRSMDGGNVHSDHHALWINPANSKHQILGNDGGINITYDSGKSWFKASTPAVGQFYAVAVDMAKPYNVYGGLQDNGVWTGPSTTRIGQKDDYDWQASGKNPYKSIMGGDGMQVQVDWRDNNTVYTGFQFGNYFRINKNTGDMKRLVVPTEVGEPRLRWNWQAPILISRHNQDVIYFGSNRFHRSLNKGDDFKTLSGDLTAAAGRKDDRESDVTYGTLTTIDESPMRFGLLYAGSDDGLIHVSKDGGNTWTRITNGLPADLWVSRVSASAHQEGTVYASLNGYRNDHFNAYVYISTDYGQTWNRLGNTGTSPLPAEPVNVVREDPKNPNLLYVGTDHGLYVSVDKGLTFMPFGADLPAVAVHDVVVHPRDNDLLIGTHGRSLYTANVEQLQQLTDSILAKPLHLFAPKPITVSSRWGKKDSPYDDVPTYSSSIPYVAKAAGKTTVTIQTEKGLLLRILTDTTEAGLNYLTFDYAVDSTQRAAYQTQLNEAKKKDDKTINLALADDKKLYIQPGKYKLTLTQNGQSVSHELEVKTPEKRPRRPVTFASPDEFEQWREEQEEEGK